MSHHIDEFRTKQNIGKSRMNKWHSLVILFNFTNHTLLLHITIFETLIKNPNTPHIAILLSSNLSKLIQAIKYSDKIL